MELEMSGTRIDRRSARATAAATRNEHLIERAAKRADWAGAALESAAGELGGADGGKADALASLAEVVLEEAAVVGRLAEDIESRKDDGGDEAATRGRKGGSSKVRPA
jgi:hypothetical protein